MATRVSHLERSVNRWLTIPEANAAGRLGLYRIIFATTALLYALATLSYGSIAQMPVYNWRPVAVLAWMNTVPSAETLTLIHTAYVVSLVFVLFGLWTRWSTLVVLISGTLFASIMYSFGKIDHADTFMRVYIPAVMVFGPWGKLYSVDALLAQRQGLSPLDPRENSLRFSWPILFLFWMLCIFFMMSGVIKAVPPGQWIVDPDLMRKFMLEYNSTPQPLYLRHVLAHIPLIPTLLLWMGLAFELFYPLAVINRHWRTFYVSSTVFFHIMTGITLSIAFDLMLFFYILFFDMWGVFDRVVALNTRQRVSTTFQRLPLAGWLMLIICVSAGLLLGYYIPGFSPLYSKIVVFLSPNIWYVAVPIAAWGIYQSLPKVVQPIIRRLRHGKNSDLKTSDHEVTSSPA